MIFSSLSTNKMEFKQYHSFLRLIFYKYENKYGDNHWVAASLFILYFFIDYHAKSEIDLTILTRLYLYELYITDSWTNRTTDFSLKNEPKYIITLIHYSQKYLTVDKLFIFLICD